MPRGRVITTSDPVIFLGYGERSYDAGKRRDGSDYPAGTARNLSVLGEGGVVEFSVADGLGSKFGGMVMGESRILLRLATAGRYVTLVDVAPVKAARG